MTTDRPDTAALPGLNRQVAEALGKTVFHSDELVNVGRFEFEYEYTLDEHGYPTALIDYEHDANAALTLTVEGYTLQVGQHGEFGEWVAVYRKDGYLVAHAVSVIPTAAICEAFLALKAYLKGEIK